MSNSITESFQTIRDVIGYVREHKTNLDCIGLSGSEQAYLLSHIYKECQRPIVFVAHSAKKAKTIMEDFRFFMGTENIPSYFLPSYSVMPFKYTAYHSNTAAERVKTLYELIIGNKLPVIAISIDALIQKLIPKKELSAFVELIQEGEEINREKLITKIVAGGYNHSLIVEEPGDFCLRGGIIDLFSPMYDYPLRIEMYGDQVESLRFFAATTQRTVKRVTEAVIVPAREFILYEEYLTEFIHRVRHQASVLDMSITQIRSVVDKFKVEKDYSGIEGLIPLIYPELDTFFNYVPDNTLWVLSDPGALEREATETEYRVKQNFETARKEKRLCVFPESLYLSWQNLTDILSNKQTVRLKFVNIESAENNTRDNINFSINDNSDIKTRLKDNPDLEHPIEPLIEWLKEYLSLGYFIVLVCNSTSRAQRLERLLKPYGLNIKSYDMFPNTRPTNPNEIFICLGKINAGFVWTSETIAVMSDEDILGPRHKRKKVTEKPKVHTELLDFSNLKIGDLVVHMEHGIGQYGGLVKLSLNNVTNDFLLLTYKDEDKLYVPVDRLNVVQKYMGVDGVVPVLDKMGGKSWEKVKEKVKQSVEVIAKELLQLYAARKVGSGFVYSPCDSYYEAFAEEFEYEETQDQQKAIDDVLNDMESEQCMDRLICGDVGYGKTEVAMRASFKAANDGKQVAILVPTTLLCEQHYTSFKKRFAKYPINIAALSRFRTQKEQQTILKDLLAGKIDIIIGTHRLVQKDVSFKDLGLVIIDEEQRFGVRHKEKLKQLRNTVDVLALTATPIPRTLHMSLMGIRDISVISTPPEDRLPIMTYVTEFDGVLIADAIKKELARKGQIFFVHNNINSIWAMAGYLQNLVPNVRLAVAHGRLNENELEKVMIQFIKQEIDMLVCTTIIESGLDIPAANSIFVNHADRFGLAQIYQLRGRVGRGDEQAYAYLFVAHESMLGKNALKRMKVLMEHLDLGDGFQIAMSDLQIRGGGAILGDAQSGHIAAVGYEMYLDLMSQAVAELQGEEQQETLEPEINIQWSVFIPESYMPDIDQRLAAYRRLSRMDRLEEIIDYQQEIIDRFGTIPKEASNLFSNIGVKILARAAGVKRLDLAGKRLVLVFSEKHQKNPQALSAMVMQKQNKYIFQFTPDNQLKITLSNDESVILQTKNILKEIGQRVNLGQS